MAARESLARKIDSLFKTVRREDGAEYTYDDVERGTEGRVSRSYVWKLRYGRNRNPSLDVLEALAEFFRVPPGYFFDPPGDPQDAVESMEIAALLEDAAAREIAFKARGLSPTALSVVADLIDNLRALEGKAPRKKRPLKPD